MEELITKYLSGEASQEEEKQVLSWAGLNSGNEKEFNRLRKIFEVSQQHYAQTRNQRLDINIDHEWNHFLQQVNTNKELPSLPLKNGSRLWLRIAAAVVALIASGWFVNYLVSKNSDVHFQTAGNTQTITLPDGTRVVLNRNSELSYSKRFGEEARTVTLTGEGFFDVAHNAQKPFIIQVSNSTIEVVGTSFDVQGYSDRAALEVVVATGIVKLSVPELKEEVRLTAGQKGIYAKESRKLSSITNADPNFLSWNTRKIVFAENDLRTVIETLSKVYHTTIVLPADIPSTCVVTVSFDNQTLDAVLHVLETTLNLTYSIKGDRIEITHAGC